MKPFGILVVACLVTAHALSAPSVARAISLYDVKCATAAPVIDGRLDDPCWQGKPAITNMVLRGGKARVPAKVQTRTTVLYDSQALYVGIHMVEPNPAGLKKGMTRYDGQLWWDDSVELYIETGCSHKEYFKFMSTPLATRADWRGKDTPMGFKMFDWGTGTSWTVGSHTGPDYWSLEFRFPWGDFEVDAPQPGSVWTFEIVRFRYAGGPKEKEYSSWNVGSTHSNPASFGNIVFSGTTSDMERLLVDQIVPVAGGDISIYAAHGEIRYTDYETLKSRKVAQARSAVSGLSRKLDGVAATMPEKAQEGVRKKIAALETKLEGLMGQAPSSATTEALGKLVQATATLAWTVRYHELNASIPSVPKDHR